MKMLTFTFNMYQSFLISLISLCLAIVSLQGSNSGLSNNALTFSNLSTNVREGFSLVKVFTLDLR